MKPSWLEMENIGPFVKRTRVDLDSIEEGGLFLISGPTGSGKSFIFDSICYALYGKTPSGRDKNLRSDHAPIGEDPIIRFCFQVGDIRYLVERTLEAPRKSGGTTNIPEKASLVKLIPDGSGGYGKEVVASKKSDVKVEVTRILGLEMEQFSRVMMIPQGEFRELLRADTDKREVLLRQLFNSLLYKDITDSIDSRSKKLFNKIKVEGTRKDTLVDTIVEKLMLDGGPGEGVMFNEWSSDVVSNLDESFREVLKVEAEKKIVWESVLKGLEIARTAYRINTELEKSKRRRKELGVIQKEEIEKISSVLDLNGKAQRLRPDLERLDGLTRDRSDLDLDVRELAGQHEKVENDFNEVKERSRRELPIKQKGLEEERNRIASLEAIFPRVQEMSALKAEQNGKEEDLVKLVKKRSGILDTKRVNQEKLVSIKKELDGLGEKEDMVKLSQLLSAGNDLVGILNQILDRGSQIQKLDERRKELEVRVKKQKEQVLSLGKRREGSIAGELASALETGKECPVCGSPDHPSPRPPSEDDISLEDLQKETSRLQELLSDLDPIKMDLNTLETSRKELFERQKEIATVYPEYVGMDASHVRRAVDDLDRKRTLLERRDRREMELTREKDLISSELESSIKNEAPLGEGISKLRIEVQGITSRLEERVSTFKGLEIDLEAKDPALKLRATISELKEKEVKLSLEIKERSEKVEEMSGKLIVIREKLKLKRENLGQTAKRLEETVSSIGSKLQKLNTDGLGDVEDLRKALLDESREREFTRRVEEFKREKIQVQSSIEALQKNFKELGEGTKPPTQEELEKVQEEEARSKMEWQVATQRKATAESDLKWTRGQLEKVEKTSEGIQEMEKVQKVVGRLSMQVKGLSNPRMSLERFFLAQRFEEVLISSNVRLKVLSGGRFLLRRADDAERGKRAKVGLDLNVYDNYTGKERPANTLSGGQMFLSSLALALGLADVVQSRSGGIRMDALFIDEGFGSLDDETLQTALKVLSELREGRMVGVISHVGELKRQIRSGFEVVPSPTGSVVRRI